MNSHSRSGRLFRLRLPAHAPMGRAAQAMLRQVRSRRPDPFDARAIALAMLEDADLARALSARVDLN